MTDEDRACLHALRSSDRPPGGLGGLSFALVIIAVARTPTSRYTPAVAAAAFR